MLLFSYKDKNQDLQYFERFLTQAAKIYLGIPTSAQKIANKFWEIYNEYIRISSSKLGFCFYF